MPDDLQFPSARDARVREALGFMSVRLKGTLHLDDLAERVRLGRRQLFRLFRRDVGITPLEVLRAMRMARARQLLKTSRLSVKEVAAECGFQDVSHFVRDFTKLHRASPAQFRNHTHSEAGESRTLAASRP
jgi:transcriptional regulator GlxA family with amidase domain